MSESHSTTNLAEAGVPVMENRHNLPVKVFALRKQLYVKAKQEPGFRFYALYDRIYRADVLGAAWALVRANAGAPGVDGVSIEDILRRPEGAEGFVEEIRQSLINRTYKPQAVRRVEIPKSNGKTRPLGIPTVRDRVVQTAAKLILEPIFEADFLDCSHGYRPGRSAHGAMQQVRKGLSEGKLEVYEADLQGYFDSIPHDKLMKAVEQRISDGSVLRLIRQWLRAPIQEPGDKHTPPRNRKPDKGTPQGGVISPLLANIYLHWFDRAFYGSSGPGSFAKAILVRYADDLVILSRYQSKRLSDWAERILESRLGLILNREKTKVTNLMCPREGFDFLGFTVRRNLDRHFDSGKCYIHIEPSKKSCQRMRASIKEEFGKEAAWKPITMLVRQLNRKLQGWKNYFQYGQPSVRFSGMNWYVQQELYSHLARRSQRAYRPPAGKSWYRHIYQDLMVLRLTR
ncbi:group II intron reverse transcriptase/maturase [Desulfurispirillum indicum]|uniref:group II intron reverse transcriptase/maturase n=1 Tax=Desulfurispirillum indicum TaxID=936456 RepID=UPI001CFBBF5D|nr:group II intron reverse transcriptase/maturase [Desulfurispirillum indicum]UCZ55574.1 group II intron reverse transcriptase/maturase [Desulfurispirillum indicum]UCZ56189.1 group II intron reverse transcriptase/maturase [Desulfurispirillum indicum]UCZ57338.1 group II intron reverse transcriptase/maturase [Desulfurispirillum indicum]UCZ57581.1 group II intron reverse transcriptase/maturase [Desulfurispirillum indicum]UCZ57679.1 group II intron reverse transcriptase/maturase [Desulfurispirillu